MSDHRLATKESPRTRAEARELPPGAGLTMVRIDQQLHFADGLPVAYMQNNKAACTSIKYSLLESILPRERISCAALHWRQEGPFGRGLSACSPEAVQEVLRRPIITVVRNPYVRILSAYLDKVRHSNAQFRPFCRRYYLDPDRDEGIRFIDFLRCVVSDHPRACNPHFRPQYANILAHHVCYDFVGSVEDIGSTADYLRGRGIRLTAWRHHATRASAHLERHYTDEAVALVERYFAEDFRLLGYPLDTARAEEPPGPRLHVPRRGLALRDFVVDPQHCAQPDSHEIEAQRRFVLTRNPERRNEIGASAATFDDWQVVKFLATAMIGADELDVAAPLLDRLLVLRTRHMEHVPERILSEQGRRLKRRREAILRH